MKLLIVIALCAVGLALADRDPRCPILGPNDDVTHVPHESDCTLFYKCDANGELHLMQCEPGLEFNPDLMVSYNNYSRNI